MKYIDADRLRAFKEALADTIVCAQGLPTYEDCKERADAETDVLLATLFPLQQEPPINTELCTLIACDIIQATAKRAIETPQDKDKEEDLMIKKMEYLHMLEKNFFQQEQPEQKKNCAECPHCVDRKDQYGWHFKGCFGGPYNGKFIAEIDECPLKQEQQKDLEEAAEKYADSMGLKDFDKVRTKSDFKAGAEWKEQPEMDLKEEITSFFSKNPIPYEHITDWPLLKNTALHFYELGLKARKEDK